mmetsp:Transcript_10096/g.24872  ORF Transcript_10096/g.24872 Transcript_10096/m.24872 type:complete len:347 (+) Transcript_10096:505-1545(+)
MTSSSVSLASGEPSSRCCAACEMVTCPEVSMKNDSHRCDFVGRSLASKRVPMSSPWNTPLIFRTLYPLATTVLTPPLAARQAAAILLDIPPLPMPDAFPISTSCLSEKMGMRWAPCWSGGLSNTPSTSVSRANPSQSVPDASRAASVSLSLKTCGESPKWLPVTTSFSLMMGMMPSLAMREIVSVSAKKRFWFTKSFCVMSTCAHFIPSRWNIMSYVLMSTSCPVAAHTCRSMLFSGVSRTSSFFIPVLHLPTPIAPLETSMTSLPFLLSCVISSTSPPIRASASRPSPFATTAVPTLITTLFAHAIVCRGTGALRSLPFLVDIWRDRARAGRPVALMRLVEDRMP